MLPETTPQLNDEQIAQIEQAKKVIPKLKEQIKKAQLAGIDVTQQQADLAALEQQLDKLYRVYVKKSYGNTSPY